MDDGQLKVSWWADTPPHTHIHQSRLQSTWDGKVKEKDRPSPSVSVLRLRASLTRKLEKQDLLTVSLPSALDRCLEAHL